MPRIKTRVVMILFVLAWIAPPMPAAGAGDGPLYTPLSAFTDGRPAKHLWTVPGVVRRNGFATTFLCTNLDFPGTTANIGVEIFDATGTRVNNVGAAPVPPATCNGALLNVAAGSTVSIANSGTAQLHEDCIISMGSIDNGSARIVSTSSRIVCSALVMDRTNVVEDPATNTPTGVSPSVATLKLIKRSKQSGD